MRIKCYVGNSLTIISSFHLSTLLNIHKISPPSKMLLLDAISFFDILFIFFYNLWVQNAFSLNTYPFIPLIINSHFLQTLYPLPSQASLACKATFVLPVY